MVSWNLEHIYPLKNTNKLISELSKKVNSFQMLRSKLNPAISDSEFLKILKTSEDIKIISSKLNAYAELWLSEKTADSKRISHSSRIDETIADASNKTMFLSLWFKELDDKNAQRLISSSGKYHYLLEMIRKFKPYTLKEKEEQVITLKSLTGANAVEGIYDIVSNRFLFDWEGKKKAQDEVIGFFRNSSPKVRKKAYNLVLSRYGEEESVLGEIYRIIVNDWKNENIKIRGFSSPISSRNLDNDIPKKAVDALLSVIQKNRNVFHEYFKLKAKICRIKSMTRYDIYAPFSSIEKNYPYEECKEFVLDTYRKFDERAYRFAKQIFDEKHVHSDIVPQKRSGAFCQSIVNNMAPYILLNHTGKERDLFTMMHEFGHGIHSLAAKEQTVFTFHSSIPMAETASIFGEMLLMQRLLRESEKEKKVALLMSSLDNQYASIMRQAYFVIFEIKAHDMIAKGATIEDLNKAYHSLLKEQFGSSISVPDVFKHEWKYIPHIYHSPFYCYAYAFGNLLVLALYTMYKKEGKAFVDKYLKILSYGGSESPSDILMEVGIDITKESFWQQGFEVIKEELRELKALAESKSI